MVKNLLANAGDAGDAGSIPVPARYPGEENGNPIQYSCLENSMGRGVWRTTVHGVTQSRIGSCVKVNLNLLFHIEISRHLSVRYSKSLILRSIGKRSCSPGEQDKIIICVT